MFGFHDEDEDDVYKKCSCSCHQCNISKWEKDAMKREIAELEKALRELKQKLGVE